MRWGGGGTPDARPWVQRPGGVMSAACWGKSMSLSLAGPEQGPSEGTGRKKRRQTF